MNDVADMVRDYLLTVSAITTLTSTRIWAELIYPPAGYNPNTGAAIVFKVDGTRYQAENAVMTCRLQFKFYGRDVYQIRDLYQATLGVLHDTRGSGRILGSQPQGPGSMLEDPRTGWPFKLEFIEVTIYSGLPTYTPV